MDVVDQGPDPEEPVVFEGLPPRPDPATWVAEQPGEPVPDSTGGRNVDHDAFLRNAGF